MMTIDQIKQCIKYADGFILKIEGDGNIWILCPGRIIISIDMLVRSESIYPLFLQRVIEGVNKSGGWKIDMFHDRIFITKEDNSMGCPFYYHKYESNDQAKESAIIWVLENEK